MSENPDGKPNVYCLMGPTASGKTALAIKLVKHLPIDIVSVDSTQIYRGMDIGSGKPGLDELQQAPHRLIDIRDPCEPYSAAEFRRDALENIADILSKNRIPLLVGGTMLYFKVLRDGLARLPQADPLIRLQIETKAQNFGWEAVHLELAQVDPESAHRIHPNDPQRLQRALEVYKITGQTMTDLHKRGTGDFSDQDLNLPYKLHFLAIQPQQRDVLHKQIAERFDLMLGLGLVKEVASLIERGDLTPRLPSIKSVGYRQVWQYLSGEIDYDEMRERGIIATRQLAKRQFTWLRSWPQLYNLGSQQEESLDKVLKFVESASI